MHEPDLKDAHGARAAVLVAFLAAALAHAAPLSAGTGYSRDGQTVVVHWQEAPAEIGDPQAAVSVTVYGDGQVMVLRGQARRDAGHYALRLSRGELDALVETLVTGGLPSFDTAVVTRAKQAAATRRAAEAPTTLRVVSDVATTTIALRLDDGQRTVVWNGVREDARNHPDIAALQGLATADAAVRALATDPRLQRVE